MIKTNMTIYHTDGAGRKRKTIRLNLKACRELLENRRLEWRDLTPKLKGLLQRRFTACCNAGGTPDFSQGCEAKTNKLGYVIPERPPSIEHLPNKTAVRTAIRRIKQTTSKSYV